MSFIPKMPEANQESTALKIDVMSWSERLGKSQQCVV